MNRADLADALADAFDADSDDARVVARAAGDLDDSGQYGEDVGEELDANVVVSELQDAPDDSGLIQRWNWWIGSLELAYGGYEEFLVRE